MIVQPGMHVLALNPMRATNIEHTVPIACGTKGELEALLAEERVEPYRDGQWSKIYRQGGPLEWFNGPDETMGQGVLLYVPETFELPHVSELRNA